MQHDVASCTARCGVVIANRDSSCCDITLSPCLALLYARHYDLGFRRHIVAQLLRLPRVWHFRFASLLQVDHSLIPLCAAKHGGVHPMMRHLVDAALQRSEQAFPLQAACNARSMFAGLQVSQCLCTSWECLHSLVAGMGTSRAPMSFHACSTSPSKAAHADRICLCCADRDGRRPRLPVDVRAAPPKTVQVRNGLSTILNACRDCTGCRCPSPWPDSSSPMLSL